MTEKPAGDPAIRVRGLVKSFGSRQALRGVDFDVERGESVVIFGPNGAGKSTLIKVLATIMNPSSGSIHIDGRDVKTRTEEVRRSLGVVTHQTFLYHDLTAGENLEFYCRMYDVPRSGERIREVADTVGMASRLHDRVGTLSRGMQQRLSIARALLHEPSVMLLDEPETGLDQQGISMLWEAVRTGGYGKRTVVLTTHNLERGLAFCERLLILARGKIVCQRSAQALDLADLKQVYQEATAGV